MLYKKSLITHDEAFTVIINVNAIQAGEQITVFL